MTDRLPFFSVIIPTYCRAQQLQKCLEAIEAINYPTSRFEVIVVDDGSTCSPDAVVSSFQNKIDIKLILQSHAGPAAARNKGAAIAKGEYYAFTDDDCLVSQMWLKNLASRFSLTPDCAIGGRTINAFPENLFADASAAILDVAYAFYNLDPNQACFFASNNLSFPAKHFRTIGGFHEDFTTSEDRELCDRWLHHGLRMIYAPEVVIYHANRLTFRTFWNQHFNYGRGAFRFHHLHAQRGWGRFRPHLYFYFSLFRDGLLQNGTSRLQRILLLFASQTSNVAGFAWQALEHRIQKRKH